MTAHEYLSQYLALQSDIERWKRVSEMLAGDECEDWIITNGAKLAASYSDMPRSRQRVDHVARAGSVLAQKHYDREKYTRENIQKARAVQLQIVQAIDAVPIDNARQVLDKRYLQGMAIEEIAETSKNQPTKHTIYRWLNQGFGYITVPDVDGTPPPAAAA